MLYNGELNKGKWINMHLRENKSLVGLAQELNPVKHYINFVCNFTTIR